MAEDIFFVNSQHIDNFTSLSFRFPQVTKGDPQYKIACYVIAHPEIYNKIGGDPGEYPVSWFFDEERQIDLSRGFRVLMDMAIHLYGGGQHEFNLADSLGVWDPDLYKMFLQCCKFRRWIYAS